MAAGKHFILETCQIPSLTKEENESGVAKFIREWDPIVYLGQVTQELEDIEIETPATLEQILMKKQSVVSDLDVGNQIVKFLQNASIRLDEVTNRGYQQIENSSQDVFNREQSLNRWKDLCNRVLNALKCLVGNYFGQTLNSMENSIARQIKEGSSNFRMEIEGYLNSADITFEKLNNDLRKVVSQVAQKFSENDGRNAKVEGMLQMLMGQNIITQQVCEQERREREQEKNEVSKKMSAIYNVLEQQQRMLATNQQTIKDEVMQEVSKKVECGVPSEVKKEPPGLLRGGDDRGLGAKREQPIGGTEEKRAQRKLLFKRNRFPNGRKGER